MDDATLVEPIESPDTEGIWFHKSGDISVGPLRTEEVRERLDAGDITPRTLVWRIGMAAWKPAAEIPQFRGEEAPPPGLYEKKAAPGEPVAPAPAGTPVGAAPARPSTARAWLGASAPLIGNLLLAALAGLALTFAVALAIRAIG